MKVDPRYVEIAKDLAKKIEIETIKVDDVLKGRTLLSSEYNVSSETIRKAINILASEHIVIVKHGYGVIVISKENASKFLKKMQETSVDNTLVEETNDLIKKRNELNEEISKNIALLVKKTSNTSVKDIEFHELTITDDCWVINQTIGDVYFYNYTEATIVAIKRGDKLIVSPGPDFTFIANDVLIVVGKDNLSYQRALTYLTYGAE
ncbi:MAG: GntR family transcriptional regulator [Erysipelotrichaceae bacterium]|nr:GntR family transcriptional regulator [Erysipelotrichaceae bacterium]